MHAIIETGGKQYKVAVGDEIFIEKLEVETDSDVSFDKIVAIGSDESEFSFGSPYLEGATVSGKVIKNGRGKKITVFTYKPKKGKHRKLGHRQPYTRVKIETINA